MIETILTLFFSFLYSFFFFPKCYRSVIIYTNYGSCKKHTYISNLTSEHPPPVPQSNSSHHNTHHTQQPALDMVLPHPFYSLKIINPGKGYIDGNIDSQGLTQRPPPITNMKKHQPIQRDHLLQPLNMQLISLPSGHRRPIQSPPTDHLRRRYIRQSASSPSTEAGPPAETTTSTD